MILPYLSRLTFIILSICCAQSTISTQDFPESGILNERWIDIDDLSDVNEGMSVQKVLEVLGEPIFFELANSTTILTYNYATKLYSVPSGWRRYQMKKPFEKRPEGAPYGSLYHLTIIFANDKLIEIKVDEQIEFILARNAGKRPTQIAKPQIVVQPQKVERTQKSDSSLRNTILVPCIVIIILLIMEV